MEVQRNYGDQVQFIGVPASSSAESIGLFITQTGIGGFPHVPDDASMLWDRFGVSSQRTYIFINDDGTLEVTGYGQLESDVQDLIAR